MSEERGLRRITAGAAVLPLGVLFALNFVDEFDRVAFAALAPEIRQAFGLSDEGISTLRAVSGVITLFAALPMGIIADRWNRVRLSVIAGLLWGVAAALTGLVGSVVLLYLVRFASGLGRITNEVVHPSLLADLYPRKAHPRVFGAHRMANAVAPVAGIVAGYIGSEIGWEAAFFVLAAPTALALLVAARLREPLRGESIDRELAAAEAGQPHVSYAEARRQLFAVPTLKRLWMGAFLFGLATLQLDTLTSLFFERVWGYDTVGRGYVQFVLGAGIVAGLLAGARAADRIAASGGHGRLPLAVGLGAMPLAAGMLLLAVAPVSAIALLGAFLTGVGYGGYQPAYFSIVGMVAPPRVRSQAYAWAILVYGAGGLSYLLLFGAFGGEDGSYRGLTAALAVIMACAGTAAASARRTAQRDCDQAALALETAVRLREELARGGDDVPLLVCRGVDVKYGSVQILFGVDVEVRQGEIVALLGTNGAGKSTLLKAICGLVDPVGGSIFFAGRDVTHLDAASKAAMGIVQVPGGKAIFPTLTVAEHFKAGTWLFANEDPAEVQRRIDEVLERFPRIGERWGQLAGNLSGGEQQQLALGMAFVAKPRLLIIDELSLGLAPTVVELLLDMVRAIHDEGCTIILVEQSVNVALTVAERAYFMEKGEVRFSGRTSDLLDRGDILRSVFLEGAGSATGESARFGSLDVDEDDAEALAAAVATKAGVEVGEPVLAVDGLTKRFGGITAVDDVAFELMPGEILGLIGPNGAGKTTIFDLVSGILPLDGGRIRFRGVDVTEWGADKRAALGLGRSFQDARIFPSLTVAENIALGLERHLAVRDHLAALLCLPAVAAMEEDVAWTVDDLVELMNLGAFRDKFVSELSTGSRRIVDLAMAIAHDPTVLILDEPSSGIAQRETEALGPLLKRIQREAGCAMLVIEHDMPLITSVSDRIVALELGAVVTVGPPGEVLADPRVVSAYLGGDLDVIQRSGASRTREVRANGKPAVRRRRQALTAAKEGS
jgi:branched-chain amino acid transport system ATP-binding protein